MPTPEIKALDTSIRANQTVHRLFWQWNLLNAHALVLQFTERALAHELLSPMGGATAQYHISLARVKLQKRELSEAEESLNEALQFDYQVKCL